MKPSLFANCYSTIHELNLCDVMTLWKLLGSLVAKTQLWKSFQSEVPPNFQQSVWSSEFTWSDVMAVNASQHDQWGEQFNMCKQRASKQALCPVFSRLISVPPTRCSSNQIIPVGWSPALHGFFSVHPLSSNQFIPWRKYPNRFL